MQVFLVSFPSIFSGAHFLFQISAQNLLPTAVNPGMTLLTTIPQGDQGKRKKSFLAIKGGWS